MAPNYSHAMGTGQQSTGGEAQEPPTDAPEVAEAGADDEALLRSRLDEALEVIRRATPEERRAAIERLLNASHSASASGSAKSQGSASAIVVPATVGTAGRVFNVVISDHLGIADHVTARVIADPSRPLDLDLAIRIFIIVVLGSAAGAAAAKGNIAEAQGFVAALLEALRQLINELDEGKQK